ncbi:oxidation resistance protein 1 [Mortierella alpina]|uniref:Oxidation resistance protein 1 n=1 Tax=Mortierella alpina TaxID=64518 RepID=A0A9P6J4F0_MORAP|nr:oxidation resistance protein 1 [Mortierella alpina]
MTKQLSFITTEQPKHGPARSTQSTLTGGDWGERTTAGGAAGVSSAGQDQQASTLHSAEPNSAASGQDPWMVVTGSGSSYASHSVPLSSSSGFPPSSSTPLGVREEQLNRLPPLQLLDRHEDSDPVLDPEVAHQIRLELPRKLRNATKWNLVYSSDQHGISMTTLYHRCKGKGPMVLAIKDSTDAVFGAYVNEEFKPNLTYYGTGECFLWNVTTLVTSPQPPPSPAFAPSPLPSPSPFQLSSTATTPVSGRSPSPSPYASGNLGARDSCNTGRGGDRRHDLFMAMNDRLSTTVVASNTNPALCSPSPLTYTPQPHLASSPSSSPTLRPVVSPSSSSSIQPRPASAARRKKKQKVVQFWKWTGKNDYMILSEPGFIGLGGGDGKFGLWIHSDLERGHSASCATFDNEPLAVACHQPLRVEDPQQQQRGSESTGRMAGVDPEKAVGGGDGSRSNSRSSSPKDDREEFFCQTVEIWAMVL